MTDATQVETPQVETQAPSVRDDIAAAIAEVNAKTSTETKAAPTELTQAAPDTGRDEHGRFKAKPDTPAQAAPSAAQTETKSPTGAAAEPQAKPLTAPATWRNEAKAKWDALDPEIKAEVLKREEDAARAATQRGDEIKQVKAFADEIEQVLGPRKAALVQNYGSVGAAIKQMFDLSDFAARDPRGFLQWFSRQSGLDATDGQQRQSEPVDPDVAALKKTIDGLQAQLQQVQGYTQHQQLASVQSEIQAFAAEQMDGKQLRPHFSKVEAQIKQLVPMLRSQNPGASPRVILQQAYDQAVYLNPEVRDQIIQERIEAEKTKLQSDTEARAAADRAERAKLAGKSITGGSPMGTVPKEADQSTDLRATIVAAMQKAGYTEARL